MLVWIRDGDGPSNRAPMRTESRVAKVPDRNPRRLTRISEPWKPGLMSTAQPFGFLHFEGGKMASLWIEKYSWLASSASMA
jgi:hypothetical protein